MDVVLSLVGKVFRARHPEAAALFDVEMGGYLKDRELGDFLAEYMEKTFAALQEETRLEVRQWYMDADVDDKYNYLRPEM